jgi:hypothetical protein
VPLPLCKHPASSPTYHWRKRGAYLFSDSLKLAKLTSYTHSTPSPPLHSQLLALGAVLMFHDRDRDEKGRRNAPFFYGALPDEAPRRVGALLALLLFTICHVFLRCAGLAILALICGPGPCLGIWLADLALYILVKMARGDFFYWIPAESFSLAVAIGLLVRGASKAMCDFSGNLQMRHP